MLFCFLNMKASYLDIHGSWSTVKHLEKKEKKKEALPQTISGFFCKTAAPTMRQGFSLWLDFEEKLRTPRNAPNGAFVKSRNMLLIGLVGICG